MLKPNSAILEYFSDLSIHNGLIFKGSKVFTPAILQENILKILHSSHLCTDKTKQRTQMLHLTGSISKFYPNFQGQKERKVETTRIFFYEWRRTDCYSLLAQHWDIYPKVKCPHSYKSQQKKEPMICTPLLALPWQHLGCYLLE